NKWLAQMTQTMEQNGYLLGTTLVWADGRSEWQPLSAIPELMSRISGAEVHLG
ncbi:hypothetical protein AALP_AAs50395U000100, partial [Arabis alpina]